MVDVVSYNSLINGFCRSSVEGHGDMLGCLLNVHSLDAVVSSFCDQGRRLRIWTCLGRDEGKRVELVFTKRRGREKVTSCR